MDKIAELKANWEAQDRLEVNLVYQELLKQPQGRKFLWHLLGMCHIGHQPFTTNALTTAFNCGELNVGQRILSELLEVDALGYVTMQKEMTNVDRTRNQSITSALNDSGTDSDPYT